MSLFGKLLALLNLIGAIALFSLAALSYSKRSAWAESALQHELAVRGLPLNAKELDKQHKPRVDRLDQKRRADLFASVGGNPVATQVDEVTRLKKGLDDAIAEAAEKDKDAPQGLARKGYALARILRGLVTTAAERDQVTAALSYFKDNASLDALKKRNQQALNKALKGPPPELAKVQRATLPEAYQFELRVEGGEPFTAFANDIAAQLPATSTKMQGVNFEQLFQNALTQQVGSLDKAYNELFNAALGQPPQGQTGAPSVEAQKAAIARLLIGLMPYQTELALSGSDAPADDAAKLKGLVPGTAAYAVKLPETDTYERLLRRAMVISGPRALAGAILDQSAAMRDMASAVRADATVEQSQFLTDNATLVRQLRFLSDVLQSEEARVKDIQALEGRQDVLTKAQVDAVLKREADLRDSIKQTKGLYDELKAKSEALLKNRQAIQGVIRDTERGEEHIRYLEKLAEGLESKSKN